MFFKNNSETKIFLKRWLEICDISHLIDDSISYQKNSLEFLDKISE